MQQLSGQGSSLQLATSQPQMTAPLPVFATKSTPTANSGKGQVILTTSPAAPGTGVTAVQATVAPTAVMQVLPQTSLSGGLAVSQTARLPLVSSSGAVITATPSYKPVVSGSAAVVSAAALQQQPVMAPAVTALAATSPQIIQQSPAGSILIQQPNPLIIMKPTVSGAAMTAPVSAAPAVISVSQQQGQPLLLTVSRN